MIRREHSADAIRPLYRVTVGHLTVQVQAADERQARLAARGLFCVELPRLWDVIDSLDDSRFVVERLT